MMKASEIRQKFLDFFASKGHQVFPSASLVPIEDPSLLWINSGVATLKKYFDGREVPENPRMMNAQKSIRTNDIENVGKTARHHTLFEMLGNFSVGDYFKKDAIHWAWEFLTDKQWIGFDPEKLSVTIHPEDDEAYDIWRNEVGVPDTRIVRLEGNFWDIGEGPSGPNSEIFYDRGPEYGNDPNDPELFPGGENERYLEVWNLVFSQFNHNPDGTYTPLPNKNIDTGMGLERMASVLQNGKTNFDTDLFIPTIRSTEQISGVRYGADVETDTAFKVIADHVRAVSFAIGDGALPSNEGRGYVLRRLLRRAVRYGRKIGITRPFLYELTPVVGETMKDFYPEVLEKCAFIQKVIKAEEERFLETLSDGLHILENLVREQQAAGSTQIAGSDAFKLYDTYGFPFDLTEDYALEHGMTVDREGFDRSMEAQRERARAAREEVDSMQIQGGVLRDLKMESQFVGYTEHSVLTSVAAIIYQDQLVPSIESGKECQVILTKTPFYAESGGQIADQGVLRSDKVVVRVKDVAKAPNGQHLHSVVIESGTLRVDAEVIATIDQAARKETVKNHTATHLMHQALKDVLGSHVNQAGSLVAPDRLRFDFSHFGSMTSEEIEQVEQAVNQKIWESIDVQTMQKPIQEAKAMGAMALFGEKYGEIVRVVQVGGYSLELCGGCHVQNTAEIGLFKILSESGIGAGVRRIEAVTGKGAYEYLNQLLHVLKEAADQLKANVTDVPKKIDAVYAQLKEVQRENDTLKSRLSHIEAGKVTEQVRDINGIKVLSVEVQASDMEQLRSLTDDLKVKIGSAIIVLGAVSGDKVNIVASVSPELIKAGYHAGNIVKAVATHCGGGGGGRPDMAQAGGKDPKKLQEALQSVFTII